MKTIFWNVDTQYDFMRDDESFKGALPVPGARSIEPNLEKLTDMAARENIKVVNTADYHTPESAEFSAEPDFAATFPSHCLEGMKGADYVPATAPRGGHYGIHWRDEMVDPLLLRFFRQIVLYKDAFDVFEGTPHADTVVRGLAPDRAIVYGVATNVCCDYAVEGLLERGIEVYAVTDAMKELPNLPLEETLTRWQEHGAKLITTNEVTDYLR